jgi:hypothetical protein
MSLTPAHGWDEADIVARLEDYVGVGIIGVDRHNDLHFGRRQIRHQTADLVG